MAAALAQCYRRTRELAESTVDVRAFVGLGSLFVIEEGLMTSTVRLVGTFVAALLVSATSGPAMAQQPEIATTVAFTEGPTADRDGNIYGGEPAPKRLHAPPSLVVT